MVYWDTAGDSDIARLLYNRIVRKIGLKKIGVEGEVVVRGRLELQLMSSEIWVFRGILSLGPAFSPAAYFDYSYYSGVVVGQDSRLLKLLRF